MFVKHMEMNNINNKLEEYLATFVESKETVKIIKPIKKCLIEFKKIIKLIIFFLNFLFKFYKITLILLL